MGREDPRKIDGVLKYHPQLVTMGQSVDLDGIAYIMKDKSSLSLGDIQSVLTNYVEAMRAALFDGKSVNIRDFGVFSLSAHTLGATTKEECTVKNIKRVNIRFVPDKELKLVNNSHAATRSPANVTFALEKLEDKEGRSSDGGNSGGNSGGDGDLNENPLG